MSYVEDHSWKIEHVPQLAMGRKLRFSRGQVFGFNFIFSELSSTFKTDGEIESTEMA